MFYRVVPLPPSLSAATGVVRHFCVALCYNFLMIVVRRLSWDPGNVAHIARHAVVPEEVEAVCHGRPLVQVGKSGRFLVIGPPTMGAC
jgi:hypothetical protein